MRKVNKSAVTGKFVSDKKVEENPKTTFKQTVNKQTGKESKPSPKKK